MGGGHFSVKEVITGNYECLNGPALPSGWVVYTPIKNIRISMSQMQFSKLSTRIVSK